MNKHKEGYKEEARELLIELESSLLELEEMPDDMDLVGRVFRAMHTIKGSGSMFGFDDIATFTHEIETVFDFVRNKEITVTKRLVDLSLLACDCISKMVNGEAVDEFEEKEIVESFRQMLPNTEALVDTEPSSFLTGEQPDIHNVNITYRIRFQPYSDILSYGTNPLLLLDELGGLGECVIIAQTDAILSLKDLNPEACYLYWDIILTTTEGTNAIKDVFIFVEDECELSIKVIDEEGSLYSKEEYKRLGDILIERGDITAEDLKRVLNSQKRIGEMLVDAEMVEEDIVQSALAEQQHVKKVRNERREKAAASSIRVAADKLDTLVDLVGELVTVQARVSQAASSRNDADLIIIAEQVEQLTGELRDNAMNIRMIPIGTTFGRFKRLVRDLSSELGREIVMKTEGGETELDKTMIEHLNDPLVHIIRNSIDHGIELPDIREARGKPKQGTICLTAKHSGTNVLIKIADDGAGLDSEAIRAKAVERGVISPDAELSEHEIFAQIFAPGFSTAKKLTDISGRGVGMDVVKRSIEALRGSIDISSQKGLGTTITLKLPLTLAIIEGLLVEVGGGSFVLPLLAIEECVELTREDIAKANGRHLSNVRGEIVPYIRLRETMMIEGKSPPIEHIVITEVDGFRVGFVVDQVIGEHQTVLKTLGKVYENSKEFSGATILADGSIALILDADMLAKTAELEERM